VYKKYIICGVICFVIGVLLTCAIGLFFFSKGNERHRQLMEQRDATINELRTSLADSSTTVKSLKTELNDAIKELEKINSQSGIEIESSLDIIQQLRSNQSELRKRLSKTTKEN
jgi:septal ring factor EnvC (AmiA/AmiB activator)